MACDEQLAGHLRAVLAGRQGIAEQRMFGGLSFLLDGRLVCGAMGDALLLRLGAEGAEAALREAHVRPMDLQRRPARGTVYVDRPGYADEAALRGWVDRALAFAEARPLRLDPR